MKNIYKKVFNIIILIILLLMFMFRSAYAEDWSTKDTEWLLKAQQDISAELDSRNVGMVQVPQGIYEVGKDIPAGSWKITILDTIGQGSIYCGLFASSEISKENQVGYFYGAESFYVYMTLSEGQYFGVDFGLVGFEPMPSIQESFSQKGWF